MALIGIIEIILAAICYSIGFWLSNRRELIWNWPFVGMLPSLLAHVHDFHVWSKDKIERSGGTFLFKGPWLTNMDMIGTCDPANVKHIMSTKFHKYPKGHEFREMFEIFGDGLFNSDSDLWKHQRKIATPTCGSIKGRLRLDSFIMIVFAIFLSKRYMISYTRGLYRSSNSFIKKIGFLTYKICFIDLLWMLIQYSQQVMTEKCFLLNFQKMNFLLL
ncbi:hypothetical protein JCGZ_09415 [Jatropha curcas]|uniref:Cytochrome P450 n=1 Tax=Jatropha curcas TaxID=180498 RepID=A0A067KGC3_JATCU|nr:hypothetical protein JCGZ_09415 [Jatropha curcas]